MANDHGGTSTAFFSGLYNEAMALIVEARDYLKHRAGRDTGSMSERQSLHFAYEINLLVSQLIQSMAWLLAQRAVFEGEIEQAEIAKPEWRLKPHSRVGNRIAAALLPHGFADLADRGEYLFRRIERLDRLLVDKPGASV